MRPWNKIPACLLVVCAACLGLSCRERQNPAASGFKLTVSFNGPAVSPSTVYACWAEDENGTDLQNLYACKRATDDTLLGTALPYWRRSKYPGNQRLDGVTGASVQGALTLTRDLLLGEARRFRVCFEIDRSLNDNAYFGDRPAFIYRSEVIDLDSLSSEYPLALYGWMANETLSGTYSQKPKSGVDIPGFASFALMADLSWIAPQDDMVSSLRATVAPSR